MNYADQAVTSAPRAAPPNPTCFAAMESVANHAAQTANRVLSLVDRLIGVPPEGPQGGGQIRGVPSGLFPAAMEHAVATDQHLGRIDELVTRLENALP